MTCSELCTKRVCCLYGGCFCGNLGAVLCGKPYLVDTCYSLAEVNIRGCCVQVCAHDDLVVAG